MASMARAMVSASAATAGAIRASSAFMRRTSSRLVSSSRLAEAGLRASVGRCSSGSMRGPTHAVEKKGGGDGCQRTDRGVPGPGEHGEQVDGQDGAEANE